VKDEQAGDLSETALEYLDLEVRGRASKLIKTGRRIPEEVISHSCMRQLLQSF
jgi:hypothetical protein